jgi:IS30 family transposase
MLVKIPCKDTTTVVAVLAKHISKLPEELRRSLTWDQGKDFREEPTSHASLRGI